MKYNLDFHHRRSIRLKGYDYTQKGLYFITVCTRDRLCLFGEIVDGNLILNEPGEIAEKCLLAIPDHFPYAKLGQFIVMPNHIHFIIDIFVGANNNLPRANNYSPLPGTSKTVGSIVRGVKIGITKWYRNNTEIQNIWQRNYYDHIIRNEDSYFQISKYIQSNPVRWQEDKYNA